MHVKVDKMLEQMYKMLDCTLFKHENRMVYWLEQIKKYASRNFKERVL